MCPMLAKRDYSSRGGVDYLDEIPAEGQEKEDFNAAQGVMITRILIAEETGNGGDEEHMKGSSVQMRERNSGACQEH